jgi:hypothetical protein
MKTAILCFISAATTISLSSCSCAIVHTAFEAKGGGSITKTSFQAAAQNAGMKSKRIDSSTYQKRGVTLSYTPQGTIVMDSCFCPTPLTLLTWGADVRSWEIRCDEIKTSIVTWYAHRGIALQPTRNHPPMGQAERDADQATDLKAPH